MSTDAGISPAWPALPLDSWNDTRETLHRWLQVIGKAQMVSTPLVNHWWNVTFQVSARGLRTGLMAYQGRPFDAELDFIDHQLTFRHSDGGTAHVTLEPKSVAQFWQEVQAALDRIDVECLIVPSPNEISPATPFAEDTQHASYDPTAAHLFWRQLLAAQRVFSAWRAGFGGKASPVQLFWGSMDLSCVLFSGAPAPTPTSHVDNLPGWVMKEAESRQNASAGFWPGGSSEGTFYAYANPEPTGYKSASLSVGSYDHDRGEWVLPYEHVRKAEDPDRTLLDFLDQTYDIASQAGGWDRNLLDIDPHRLDEHIYRGTDHTPLY